MTPQRVNLAVAFLDESGFIESIGGFGIAPFDFQRVRPTVFGHQEAQRFEGNGQATNIEKDATAVLRTLVGWEEKENDPQKGGYRVSGTELTDALALSPGQVNLAVALLEKLGFVDLLATAGNDYPST